MVIIGFGMGISFLLSSDEDRTRSRCLSLEKFFV